MTTHFPSNPCQRPLLAQFLTLVCFLLGLSLVATSGCGTKSSESRKWGVIVSLTGESARYGQSVLNGIQLATDEINLAGGVAGKHIDLVIEDDGSQSISAVSAFTKLATVDKVPVIIGPTSSSASMACSPLANQYKVLLFTPSAATPSFTSPGDFTFRNRVSSDYEVSVLAETGYKSLGLRAIAILSVNNDYGKGNESAFGSAFAALGGKVTAIETFQEGSNSMRSQLAKIKGTHPDGLFLVGQGNEAGYALKELREMGIKCQVLSTITIQRDDVMKIAGDAANGAVYALPRYDTDSNSPAFSFEKKYRNRFNKSSDMFSGNGYDAVFILSSVIESAGSDPAAIGNAITNIHAFKGVTGLTTFDVNGDVQKPIAVKQVLNRTVSDFAPVTK